MMNNTSYHSQSQGLDLSRFQAINAVSEKADLSSKYSFIPTTTVINAFAQKGWMPVKASEVRCLKEERKGFQKHLIRFRQENSIAVLDEVHPEIVLTNSHDGLASFQIMAGLFRLVCLNGLVVADSTFAKHSIRHMGYTDQAVHLAIEELSDSIPMITNKVKDFKEIELTKNEKGIFAAAALTMKYGENALDERDFDIDNLTAPVRRADTDPTLWAGFNTIQEKFIRGGRFEKKTSDYGFKHTVKARGTKNINEDIRINRGLWLLTEKMAELKKAA